MKITFDEKTADKIKAFGDVDLVFDFDHTLSEVNTEVDACAGEFLAIVLLPWKKETFLKSLMQVLILNLDQFIIKAMVLTSSKMKCLPKSILHII